MRRFARLKPVLVLRRGGGDYGPPSSPTTAATDAVS